MKKSISIMLCLVFLLSFTLVGCGGTEKKPQDGSTPVKTYNIKLAYTPGSMPATDSPDIMFAEVFKKEAEEKSNGAIKVELYPSGQLGSADEAAQGVKDGNIEMSIIDINVLNSLYEESMLLSTPGLFSSVEECDAILNGDWGTNFSNKVKDSTGIKILTMHSKGFRNFTTSNKELRTVDDAKGVVFRVMQSPVSIKMVEALGAKAVPMAGSEMYVAMQNGVVDGQENPVLNIIQDKTYEVQKYLVLDGHIAGIMAYIINGDFYDSLPADLQEIIENAAEIGKTEAQEVVETKNTEGIEILKNEGMIVYQPTEEELAGWHEAMYGPCQEYVRTTIGDEPVDELNKTLEAYRNK